RTGCWPTGTAPCASARRRTRRRSRGDGCGSCAMSSAADTQVATAADPALALETLAASRDPYFIGVRHHSPALAAAVPALLDEFQPEVLLIELPAEAEPWLGHLADPET